VPAADVFRTDASTVKWMVIMSAQSGMFMICCWTSPPAPGTEKPTADAPDDAEPMLARLLSGPAGRMMRPRMK